MVKPLVEEMLNDARILAQSGGSNRSVINRIYYSVFHASRALLIHRGFEPRSHKGTINLFWTQIAHEGICSKESAKFLSKAFQSREEADYEPSARFDDEELDKQIEKAAAFLEEIRGIINIS